MSGFKIAGIAVLALIGGLLAWAQLQNMGILERPASTTTATSYADVEKRIVQQVNAERMKHGLNALVWSDDLARVAQNHSSLMARTQLFEHSGNQYYNCMGENIMKRSGSSNIASANEVV